MTSVNDIPEPLGGHHVRLHSGADVGVCTGDTVMAANGLHIAVRWSGVDGWTLEHVNDLVWLNTINDLGA